MKPASKFVATRSRIVLLSDCPAVTRRRFCAVLLGLPEEIALCALSTHYALAAASFNLGTCTLLPHTTYALTELLLHSIVFFCRTHFDTRMLNADRLWFQIIPDIIPNNATSKYKLILQCITVNAMGYVYLFLAEQTLTHMLLS